jgi:hypothetical protein
VEEVAEATSAVGAAIPVEVAEATLAVAAAGVMAAVVGVMAAVAAATLAVAAVVTPVATDTDKNLSPRDNSRGLICFHSSSML